MALELKAKLGHPPSGYILVEMDKIEKVSAGGIIIAGLESTKYAQSAVSTGIVKEIGPECWGDSALPWVEVGDRVWFEKYQGQEYKSGDDLFRTMPYYSIRMLLRKEEF